MSFPWYWWSCPNYKQLILGWSASELKNVVCGFYRRSIWLGQEPWKTYNEWLGKMKRGKVRAWRDLHWQAIYVFVGPWCKLSLCCSFSTGDWSPFDLPLISLRASCYWCAVTVDRRCAELCSMCVCRAGSNRVSGYSMYLIQPCMAPFSA